MASIRQEKIAGVLQQDLGIIFQQNSRTLCDGAMVSVTVVRVTPDMSIAKVYISIFGHKDPDKVLQTIKENASQIKHEVAQKVRFQLRKMPNLIFYRDDSMEYAAEIDSLLKDT